MKIINCLSLGEMCEAALDGEPVFILRAKDNLAMDTLIDYHNRALANKATNTSRISDAKRKFASWRIANTNKCKNPD